MKVSFFLFFVFLLFAIPMANANAVDEKQIALADSLYFQLNFDSSIVVLKKISLNTKLSPEAKAKVYYKIGIQQTQIQQYDSAQQYLSAALKLLQNINNLGLKTDISIALFSLPKNLIQTDLNIKKLYLITKLTEFKKINPITKARLYWYWISISWHLDSIEDGVINSDLLLKTIDAISITPNSDEFLKYSVFEHYCKLSSFYITGSKDTARAQYCLKKAASIMNKDLLLYQSFWNSSSGNYFFSIGDLKKTKEYYSKNIEIAPKYNVDYSSAQIMLGKVLYLQDSIAAAIPHMLAAKENILNIQIATPINQHTLKWLANVYIETDDSKSALKYLVDYTYMTKILNDSRNIGAINLINFIKQYDKSEQEKRAFEEKHLYEKNIYQIIISFFAIIMLVFLMSFVYYKRLNTKLSAKKKELEKALETNSLLTKEMHHRVKNNLQMVSGLLNLQSKNTKNEEAYNMMKVAENRIQSVAILHQNLYQDDLTSKGDVNFYSYLSGLAKHIAYIFKNENKEIKVVLKLEKELVFPLMVATPLGLILNEFLTNSYKHAFKDRTNGLIEVSLIKTDDGFSLEYKDNGIGLKNGNKNNFGLSLIDMLILQLNAKLEVLNKSESGIFYRLSFKIQE